MYRSLPAPAPAPALRVAAAAAAALPKRLEISTILSCRMKTACFCTRRGVVRPSAGVFYCGYPPQSNMALGYGSPAAAGGGVY